jgi:hypothetical protein
MVLEMAVSFAGTGGIDSVGRTWMAVYASCSENSGRTSKRVERDGLALMRRPTDAEAGRLSPPFTSAVAHRTK